MAVYFINLFFSITYLCYTQVTILTTFTITGLEITSVWRDIMDTYSGENPFIFITHSFNSIHFFKCIIFHEDGLYLDPNNAEIVQYKP